MATHDLHPNPGDDTIHSGFGPGIVMSIVVALLVIGAVLLSHWSGAA